MRHYTPFGELELPRAPKNEEEEKLLMASLQGSYEVMAGQGYSLDDINKFAVANWLECVGPKPTTKRLVEVVENGRKFMRLQ